MQYIGGLPELIVLGMVAIAFAYGVGFFAGILLGKAFSVFKGLF